MPASPALKDRYFCPAKLNIGLEVLFKRPDGYHELNTVFAKVKAPVDSIEVSQASEFQLTCSDSSLDVGDTNLVLKAVKAYVAASGQKGLPQLHLHLVKEIPTGAGLGGGSSDAAQTIHICNDYFGQPLPLSELLEVGRWVGADVPFFVSGYVAAAGGGIGEKLEEIQLPTEYGVLIVKPPSVSVPTAQAYAKLTVNTRRSTDLEDSIRTHQWECITNDFEPVIFAANPELADIKQEITDTGAFFASMSGSGSAIFGMFDNLEKATEASKTFAVHNLPCWATTFG